MTEKWLCDGVAMGRSGKRDPKGLEIGFFSQINEKYSRSLTRGSWHVARNKTEDPEFEKSLRLKLSASFGLNQYLLRRICSNFEIYITETIRT